MSRKKISIIIPNYNNSHLIKEAINSIVKNSNIEIIIIDDKSTDNSKKVLSEIKQENRNVKIIYNEKNLGLGLTRNVGIVNAIGDFLLFLDADDKYETKIFKEIFRELETDDFDLLNFQFNRKDYKLKNTKKISEDTSFLNYAVKETLLSFVFQGKLNLGACFNIYKTNFLRENNLYFTDGLHEDLIFTLKAFYFAKKVKFLNKPFYIWRENRESITGNFTKANTQFLIKRIIEFKNFLISEQIYEEYRIEHLLFTCRYINYLISKRSSSITLYESKIIYNTFEKLEYKSLLKNNLLIVDNPYLENIRPFPNHLMLFIFTKIVNKLKNYYKLLKNIQNKILKEIQKIYSIMLNFNSKFDIIFLPQNLYHYKTMVNLAESLTNLGFKAGFINPGYKLDKYKFLNKEFKESQFKVFSESYLKYKIIKTKSFLCMNDWDKQFTYKIIETANQNNIKTIGLIEGINDFLDIDTGRNRNAYKSVKYLLLTGEHDKQFFKNVNQEYFTVGIPRLENLKKQNVYKANKKTVLINLNFTFNVLTEYSRSWISEVIQACEELNLQYKITKHPDDKTEVDENFITSEQIYDGINNSSVVISRFSTVIIEALALGKPVVYHNPGFEKVEKFKDSLGAYSISSNIDQLKKAIMFELEQKDIRVRANDFLQMHANINFDSLEKTKNAIITILNNDGK